MFHMHLGTHTWKMLVTMVTCLSDLQQIQMQDSCILGFHNHPTLLRHSTTLKCSFLFASTCSTCWTFWNEWNFIHPLSSWSLLIQKIIFHNFFFFLIMLIPTSIFWSLTITKQAKWIMEPYIVSNSPQRIRYYCYTCVKWGMI